MMEYVTIFKHFNLCPISVLLKSVDSTRFKGKVTGKVFTCTSIGMTHVIKSFYKHLNIKVSSLSGAINLIK